MNFCFYKLSFPHRKDWFPHLASDVDRDADDHGGNGDPRDERDADGRSDQRPQLPQDLLLPAPRLLPPEGAAGRTGGEGGGM